MKKIFLLTIILLFGFSLISCTKDEIVEDDGFSNIVSSDNLTEEDMLFFEKVESYIRSFVKSPTRDDLKLKTNYYSTAVQIEYVSSNPDVLTNDGKYIEHDVDVDVVLKCILTLEDKKYVFSMNVTSTGIPDKQKLEVTKNYLEEYFKTTELKEGTILPTTHPKYGGRIRWVCEDPSVIVDYKTINLPLEEGTYRLIAEINFPTPAAYEIVQYPVTLSKTSLTKEERTINFIKQSMVSTEGDFVNLYEGSSVEINRSKIINIEDELEQYWTYGYKPDIPQSALN